MTLDDFLAIPYERNARGPDTLDCWGQVRLAREHLFSREPLPMFSSVASGDVRSMTREVVRTARNFQICEPRPGAIATGWYGRTCPHVGIVVVADGALKILDTDVATGPKITSIRAFKSRFTKVVFYDN